MGDESRNDADDDTATHLTREGGWVGGWMDSVSGIGLCGGGWCVVCVFVVL